MSVCWSFFRLGRCSVCHSYLPCSYWSTFLSTLFASPSLISFLLYSLPPCLSSTLLSLFSNFIFYFNLLAFLDILFLSLYLPSLMIGVLAFQEWLFFCNKICVSAFFPQFSFLQNAVLHNCAFKLNISSFIKFIPLFVFIFAFSSSLFSWCIFFLPFLHELTRAIAHL